MTLPELIARLEKASGPDRELDLAIVDWLHARRIGIAYLPYPFYTASIDDARTLLPWDKHPGCELHVRIVQGARDQFSFVEFTWPSTERQAHHRSEAIATCICALLAIEETERQLAPTAALKSRTNEREG